MPNIDKTESAETINNSEIIRKRVFYLDFIRAISICLIIIYHFNVHLLQFKVSDDAIFWTKSGLDHTYLGIVAVSLFIILSGASLMLSTKERFDVKAFFRKRFFSIYPLFWVTYAATFLTLLLIHQRLPSNAHPLTFFLTIIGFDGFLLYAIPNFYLLGEWFLGLIIIMYILFPFLRYLFLKNALFTVLLCFFITLLVPEFYHPKMNIDRFPLFRITDFVLGMSFIHFYSPSRRPGKLILFAMAGLLFYCSVTVNIPVPFNLAMWGISAFMCLTIISAFFDNALLAGYIRFLSAYSFGAFLVHHVIFLQILPFLANQHLSTFSSYLLFFALLFVSYFLSFLLTNVTAFGLRKIGVGVNNAPCRGVEDFHMKAR